jgi:hypothetical protein
MQQTPRIRQGLGDAFRISMVREQSECIEIFPNASMSFMRSTHQLTIGPHYDVGTKANDLLTSDPDPLK